MNTKLYVIIGGIVVIVGLGVASWLLFSDDATPTVVTEDTTTEDVEDLDLSITGTLAFQQGSVEILTADGEDWETVETDTVVRQSDSIRTGDDSKAIIEFENGDILRLSDNAHVVLSLLDETQVVILQRSGTVFNRVAKDQERTYQIVNGDIIVEALGTAFDVEDKDASVGVNVVESKVKVHAGTTEEEVEEGKSAEVTKQDKKLAVNDFDESKLSNEWYTWNKEQDETKTTDLGLFAKKTEEKEEVKEEEKKEETEQKEEEKKEEEKKEEEPEPEPEPTYTGPSLSVTAAANGVNMWWSDKSENPGFKYYKVVRSTSNADPKYPDDGYIAVRNKGEEHYSDASAVKNKSYYYRVCAVGDQVLCGNVRQVTAINDNPVPSAVSLSASVVGDAVVLSWTKSSEADFSAYKVVWSQTDSTPTYPDNGHLKALGQSTLTYTHDTDEVDLLSGTHYYSVCVLDSAGQVACSNVVTVVDGVVQ